MNKFVVIAAVLALGLFAANVKACDPAPVTFIQSNGYVTQGIRGVCGATQQYAVASDPAPTYEAVPTANVVVGIAHPLLISNGNYGYNHNVGFVGVNRIFGNVHVHNVGLVGHVGFHGVQQVVKTQTVTKTVTRLH